MYFQENCKKFEILIKCSNSSFDGYSSTRAITEGGKPKTEGKVDRRNPVLGISHWNLGTDTVPETINRAVVAHSGRQNILFELKISLEFFFFEN